jgi:imidazolonepropionase-like amidohydrolase
VRLNDSLGAIGIKIHQLFLQDTVFMKSMLAVQDEIAKTNNKMIVHATALEQAKQALRFNAKILVHSVDDYPIDDEFVRLAKEMNVIYCPTLIVLKGYVRAFESLQTDFILNDPNNAVDADTKLLMQSASSFFKFNPHGKNFEVFLGNFEGYVNNIQKTMFDNLKRVHEEGITIAVSTDAGNPGTLHGISIYDEMEAMQAAGIEAEDIIQMATKNGAIAMERLNDFGTLEMGKMADLIVLDSDPSTDISNMRSITHVMRGGFLRPVNEPFQ